MIIQLQFGNDEIHHIGSTAVPGLGGKGIVDIMITLKNWRQKNQFVKKLKNIGFSHIHHLRPHEPRIFLSKIKLTKYGDIHVHLVKKNSKVYQDLLLFRDYLRNNKKEAEQYFKIKKKLLKDCQGIRNIYRLSKNVYILKVLKKARASMQPLLKQGGNKKILIMGLGLHGGGVSSAAFFARLGCQVIVTDLKHAADLKPSINKLKKFKNIKYVLGRHRKNDFSAKSGSLPAVRHGAFGGKNADLIIRNPAVPNDSLYLTIARQNKIPVHTDISWFLKKLQATSYKLQAKTIGITGTKGKSTTAALLQHVLTKCGKKSILAGNIKKSPLDFIKIAPTSYKLQVTSYMILELSSWHLESLDEHKLSPNIAVITNIMPDHLNRYKNFADYKRAKTFIFKHQTANDALFLNKNDQMSRQIGKNKSIKSKIIWYGGREEAVLAVADFLNLNKKSVQSAIKTFPGLEGRLELVDIINEVKYYNDTCATQPEATMYAIGKLKTQNSKLKTKVNIILIAGGEDKNLKYDNLARAISKDIKTLILFKGSASDKIITALKKYPNISISQYLNIQSMKQAVIIAKDAAQKNDIILLSPASASFGLFKHEFDRGEQFKICVKKIKKVKNRTAQTTG